MVQKRSGIGHYGLGGLSLGHGYGLGHGYSLGHGLALGGGTVVGADVHTTVTKHIGVPVPAPYPVAVDRPVPYPVKVSFFYKAELNNQPFIASLIRENSAGES